LGNLVGYTLQELIEYLESISNFTIQDYLNGGLHIDHIIPISAYYFNSFKDEEFKKCWNYRNLRLIEAKENLLKHDKLDKKLIEYYNIEDLLPKSLM
jgi:5-methylcytosine-specific restriction endonuclease McrA